MVNDHAENKMMRVNADDSCKPQYTRILLSYLFLYLTLLFLIFSVYSLGEAWLHAMKDGWIPEEWGKGDSNHGPWRHYYPGGALLWRALNLQMISFLTALISMLIKRSWRGFIFLIISIAIFFATLATHYWLVD